MKKRHLSHVAAVAHTTLSLENYAQIYYYIREIKKNKEIQVSASAGTSQIHRFLTRKNISEVLRIHGLSGGRHAKKALLEGLELLEIFNPHRCSADLDNFDFDLQMEDMEGDLAALGWLECPSKSVIGSNPAHSPPDAHGIMPARIVVNESPIFSSQRSMSTYSDAPSSISAQITMAEDSPGKV